MKTFSITVAAAAVVALLASGPAYAFGDSDNTNNNSASAGASASSTSHGGAGGQGGAGGHGGKGGQGGKGGAVVGSGNSAQDQNQGQAQGQLQGQGQEQAVNNSDKLTIEGDDVETTVTNVNTPSVNPTVVCAQAVNVGAGVLGFGGSAGFSYTDEDCNDREWARIGLESGDAEVQKLSKSLLLRVLQSRLNERYPEKPAPAVTIGSSTYKSDTLSNVPDWCYGMDPKGRSTADKRACGLDS